MAVSSISVPASIRETEYSLCQHAGEAVRQFLARYRAQITSLDLFSTNSIYVINSSAILK